MCDLSLVHVHVHVADLDESNAFVQLVVHASVQLVHLSLRNIKEIRVSPMPITFSCCIFSGFTWENTYRHKLAFSLQLMTVTVVTSHTYNDIDWIWFNKFLS